MTNEFIKLTDTETGMPIYVPTQYLKESIITQSESDTRIMLFEGETELHVREPATYIFEYLFPSERSVGFSQHGPNKEKGQDWVADLIEFHKAMDLYVAPIPSIPPSKVQCLRNELNKEEFDELQAAVLYDDLIRIADGIADLIYVLLGMAISYGIDLRPIWDEVHRTNMAKVNGPIREDGKRLKPPGWKPPDIKGILDKQEPLI